MSDPPLSKKPRANSMSEFSLPSIRAALIRQEETIIFAIIERGQYALNAAVYDKARKEMKIPGEQDPDDSFFEHFLYQTEKLHARLGRYRAHDLEHPFFKRRGLPQAALAKAPVEPWGRPLKANDINLNDEILRRYVSDVVKKIAGGGIGEEHEADDGHYGSTAVSDIALIQALSYRIHFGKLVAESKFRAHNELFTKLIKNRDAKGIMEALTDEAVERAVIERVRRKAARLVVLGFGLPAESWGTFSTDTTDVDVETTPRYGRETDGEDENSSVYKVNPNVVADLYRDFLIPLNKDVQVAYLLARLEEDA